MLRSARPERVDRDGIDVVPRRWSWVNGLQPYNVSGVIPTRRPIWITVAFYDKSGSSFLASATAASHAREAPADTSSVVT